MSHCEGNIDRIGQKDGFMRDDLKKEFTRRIAQATPVSMITILYDMALVYIKDAKAAHERQEEKTFLQEIHRAQDCLMELLNSLDMRYEPAAALRDLYLYMHKEFAGAIISFSQEKLVQPESILTRLRDAYLELEKTGAFEPVMDNAQQIYAGLTYGKNSLVESLAQPVKNRGFLA